MCKDVRCMYSHWLLAALISTREKLLLLLITLRGMRRCKMHASSAAKRACLTKSGCEPLNSAWLNWTATRRPLGYVRGEKVLSAWLLRGCKLRIIHAYYELLMLESRQKSLLNATAASSDKKDVCHYLYSGAICLCVLIYHVHLLTGSVLSSTRFAVPENLNLSLILTVIVILMVDFSDFCRRQYKSLAQIKTKIWA